MTESDAPRSSRPTVRRRRRANIAGKTQYVQVSMSEVERAALYVLEAQTRRSPSEILVSAALTARGTESEVDRQALMYELAMIRRYLLALSNNTNQLARHANATDEFPDAARAVVSRTRAVTERVSGVIDSMVGR